MYCEVNVGERIRYFRNLRGWSQETLALQAEINPAFLGHGIARTGQGGRRGRAESGAADHRGDEDGELGGSAHGRPRRQAACSREHRCKGRRTARRDQVEQRYCCHKYSKNRRMRASACFLFLCAGNV